MGEIYHGKKGTIVQKRSPTKRLTMTRCSIGRTDWILRTLKGFIAKMEDLVIKNEEDRPVYDLRPYAQ
jgi:hypothetical protein